jgi:hypothetical protein
MLERHMLLPVLPILSLDESGRVAQLSPAATFNSSKVSTDDIERF